MGLWGDPGEKGGEQTGLDFHQALPVRRPVGVPGGDGCPGSWLRSLSPWLWPQRPSPGGSHRGKETLLGEGAWGAPPPRPGGFRPSAGQAADHPEPPGPVAMETVCVLIHLKFSLRPLSHRVGWGPARPASCPVHPLSLLGAANRGSWSPVVRAMLALTPRRGACGLLLLKPRAPCGCLSTMRGAVLGSGPCTDPVGAWGSPGAGCGPWESGAPLGRRLEEGKRPGGPAP